MALFFFRHSFIFGKIEFYSNKNIQSLQKQYENIKKNTLQFNLKKFSFIQSLEYLKTNQQKYSN